MIQKALRLISLHPKLAASLDALVGLFFLWLVRFVDNWYGVIGWTVVRILWWVMLSQFMYYPSYAKRLYHWLSLFFFQIGIVGYFIFLEPGFAYVLMSFLFVLMPFYSFWLVPEHEQSLPVVAKSYRRWRLIASVGGVAGLATNVFALVTFQLIDQTLHTILAVGTMVVMVAFISCWWWYEYGIVVGKKFWLAGACMILLLSQFAYVFVLLPWGFLVGGLMFVWIWYLLWLMMRFHLSTEGVNWQKQRWFLITNSLLIIIFLLFIVRWH